MTDSAQAEVPVGMDRTPLDMAVDAIGVQFACKDQRIQLLECALVTVAANLRRAPDKASAVAVFASAIMCGRTLQEAVGDAEKVGDPASIVEATPCTPVQSAGEAFHETGVSLKVGDTLEPWSDDPFKLSAELRRVASGWREGFRLPQLLRDAADQIDTTAHVSTPPAPASDEADRRELDELLAAWRASLANPATWMQRLRGLLLSAPPSVAGSLPSATDGVEAETGGRVTQAGVAGEARAREVLASVVDKPGRRTFAEIIRAHGPNERDRFTGDEVIAAMLAFAARPAGEGERLREAQADIAFLLARSGNAGKCMFGGERWTGISSNALVAIAFGEEDAGLPSDSGDLAACYRAVMRLPTHRLTAAVFEHLERGEQHVEGKYPGSIDEARKAVEWPGRAALATEGTRS